MSLAAATIDLNKHFRRVVGVAILLLTVWAAFVNWALGPIPGDLRSIVLALAATALLHELLHVAAAAAVGARGVRVGVWRIGRLVAGFYVRIDSALELRKWLAVGLAPLILSVSSLTLAHAAEQLKEPLAWISLLNTAGFAGDFALMTLAAGAGKSARVRDMGAALIIEGGEPSRLSWAILNAAAAAGYTLLASTLAALLLIVAACVRGGATELLGAIIAECRVIPRGGVVAQVGAGFFFAAAAAAAAVFVAAALASTRGRQRTYT